MASSGHYGDPLSVNELECLDAAIKNASDLGMASEFWGTFLQGIRQGESIQSAVAGANNEWDL